MALMHENIDDFVLNTINKFIKGEWTDISLPLQKYYFAARFGRGRKFPDGNAYSKKKPIMHSAYLEWRIQHRNTGTFANSELFAVETSSTRDLFVGAKIPWSKQVVSMTWDQDEDLFQMGPEVIINDIVARKHAMYNDFYEGMEEEMWAAPTSSSESPRSPYSLTWWVQQSTTAAFGFNGTDPSGFSDGRGGVSSSTYPRWANGTFTYNTVSDDDLVKKMAEAYEKCGFFAPHDFKQIGPDLPQWEIYTVYSVKSDYEDLLTASNDNLGKDAGKFRNISNPNFKGTPIRWVPALDNSESAAVDANNPIYGINWAHLCYVYHKSRDMKLCKPMRPNKQPTVREVWMDNWGQFWADNLRCHWVGRVAA
jgi:hypothetical protein